MAQTSNKSEASIFAAEWTIINTFFINIVNGKFIRIYSRTLLGKFILCGILSIINVNSDFPII